MKLGYEQRLKNIQNRRFDNELNESILTKSFSSTNIPKNIKYLMESMVRIDNKYNDKTIEAAKRVQTHLENGYDLHFKRKWLYQCFGISKQAFYKRTKRQENKQLNKNKLIKMVEQYRN